MNKEVLIKAENVSKKFCRDFKRSLWYGMKDMGSALFNKDHSHDFLRKDEFWAVKNISFEVRRGECLGLIGHNGAGKSTLLKMLNGLINPDQGRITMRGRIGALIELAAGFNPLLTGKENIYNNGAVLGFSKKEIDSKYKTIVDFAELGDFINAPVQNYSSGMKVRLGFAVAAQLEPDILLIDEVLAVGDMGFKLKSFRKIDEILPNTAVIFVSHAMPQISRICNNLLLMNKGIVEYQGTDISKGIDIYYENFSSQLTNYEKSDQAELISIQFDENPEQMPDKIFKIKRLEDLKIYTEIAIDSNIDNPNMALIIFDKEFRPIGIINNEKGLSQVMVYKEENGKKYYKVKTTVPRINLSKGLYSITVILEETFQSKPLLRIQSIKEFQVISETDIWQPIEFESNWDKAI